jgi:hypothetical protein
VLSVNLLLSDYQIYQAQKPEGYDPIALLALQTFDEDCRHHIAVYAKTSDCEASDENGDKSAFHEKDVISMCNQVSMKLSQSSPAK